MEDLQKEFIPYERALRLKALGYNKPSLGYFDDTGWLEIKVIRSSLFVEKVDDCCLAPTFPQAFRWFREKYDMAHQVTYAGAKGRYNAFTDDWVYDSSGELKEFSYEEAELACLDKLIEIVESKQRINKIIKDVQDGR